MECFRQIIRLIKSPFKRIEEPKVLEIGPPTNFRKEELPAFFSDADTLASHDGRISAIEKHDAVKTVVQESSTREKIKNHVRRMSVKLANQSPATE